jgi:hypothetical protein
VCSGSAEYVGLVSGVGVWVVVLGWCVEEVWGRVKCRVGWLCGGQWWAKFRQASSVIDSCKMEAILTDGRFKTDIKKH